MLENLKESVDGVGWFGRARRFIVEARMELSRVTWPTRREVWATSVVVILVSIFFGVYLWVIDLGLNQIMERILGFGA